MTGCQKGHAKSAQKRQVQPIDMRVNDIKFGRVPGNPFQPRCRGNHRVRPWAAEAKSPRPDCMELGGGLRIPAGEQRHLMPQAYQFIDQPRHHTLGAPVKLGRNTFGQRRYLGNSQHRLSAIEVSGALESKPIRPPAVRIWTGGRANPLTAGSSESSAARFLSPANRSARRAGGSSKAGPFLRPPDRAYSQETRSIRP